ncbi:hypothetical protein [Stenotrophomonas rhizophila]|uniref:hypothetical protein n=1 Tax=Stenotrophomonas rhizophila TaxID=216778 RepID=UPI001E436123|nr:hypothetical protein [Stenotrophomonas rhizophila]MCC7635601.1 hypothetical protein [Stenotrophomonas rhizophila]MCC7665244.1 hypothetical protein [Stenotrophomonas rhizophila]
MASRLHNLFFLFALGAPAMAEEGKVFASFSVVEDGVDQAPRFVYSEAAASETDPIVISVEGRPLTVQDLKYRVDLQKNWLSANVPERYTFVGRNLVLCSPEPERKAGRCDRYEFTEADTVHAYYFRVDSWPQ